MSRARDLADSADLNFDDGTLVIDSGNNRVGIGTASPALTLDVAGRIGTTIAGTAADPAIQVDDDGANMVGFFQAGSGALGFSTNGSESMTLNSSGNLAIGRGSAQVAGIELYKSAPIIRWTDSNNDSYAEIRGNNGNFAIRADHGNTQSGSGISLEVDGSTVVYIDGSGLSFDSGSNHLDDYEEGTWTPSLVLYGGTPTIANSFYTKVGRVVTAVCTITLDGTNDGSIFQVSGLPFTSANIGNGSSYSGGFVFYTTSTLSPIYVMQNANGTTWELFKSGGSNATYIDFGVSSQIRAEIIYFAA